MLRLVASALILSSALLAQAYLPGSVKTREFRCYSAGAGADAATYTWKTKTIGYYIGPIPVALNGHDIRSEIRRALRRWEQKTPFRFVETFAPNQPETIDFRWLNTWERANWFPGELAHAYFPPPGGLEPTAGDVEMNPDVEWNFGEEVDVFSVVLHEVGHSLGLWHTWDEPSVMAPLYRLYSVVGALDIAKLKEIYPE
jgi:hypothetical protein